MAAGTIGITKTLDQIKVVAAAVTGLTSARVFQGYKRFTSAEDFYADVKALTAESQAFFSYWFFGAGHGVHLGASGGSPPVFNVRGELVCSVNKDSSTDFNSAIELAERLKDALLLASNFTGFNAPFNILYELGSVEIVEKRGIIFWSFGAGGAGEMAFYGGC